MRSLFWFLIAIWALDVAGAQARAQSVSPDEQILRGAHYEVDGPALLKFFRDHIVSAQKERELEALIGKLGDRAHPVREQATEALIELGTLARPLLVRALESADPEIARRAELCLRKIPKDLLSIRAAAAARLLTLRKPAGAAEVLLGYLPFAPDAHVGEEIKTALVALGKHDAKTVPVLVETLVDRAGVKRAAAAEVLCRLRASIPPATILKVAKGLEPKFRYHVAQALVDTRHAEGIPLLIALIEEMPRREVWRVEEVLAQIAGDDAPVLAVDAKTPAGKVRQAWTAWWKKHAATIDLAKLAESPRSLGCTLITQMDNGKATGSVFELGPTKEQTWRIEGLRYPVDAQVVGKDRVLVAEYLGRRVCEFDFKGKLLWEKQVDTPIGCQRLPNGDTFIVSRRQLVVVDRDGRETFTYQAPATNIAAGHRLRNGHMIVVNIQGQCIRLDETGKQQSSFPVGNVYGMGGILDVSANGRVLIPEYRANKVVEYDADGKAGWSVEVKSPTSAMRLPNGNFLVVSLTLRRVSEINRQGQEVWSYQSDGNPWRARRR